MRNSAILHTTSGIVLFYPGPLLTCQIHDWARRHGGCRAAVTYERSFPDIRRWLRRATFAVIDASEDPAQASDAFLQAIGVQRASAVAVYTEKMHDGLELLVRVLGAPLLLGPMSMGEWEEFLEHKFPMLIPLESSGAGVNRGQRETLPISEEKAGTNVVYYRPIAG